MTQQPKRLKTYSVWMKATIDCSINIEASSLEDAVKKGESLHESNFFKVLGQYNDGNCKVYGVMEESS